MTRALSAQPGVDLDGVERSGDLDLGGEAQLVRLTLANRVLARGDVGEVRGVGLVPDTPVVE